MSASAVNEFEEEWWFGLPVRCCDEEGHDTSRYHIVIQYISGLGLSGNDLEIDSVLIGKLYHDYV